MSLDIHDINCIQFGILSPQEIRDFSVCKIDNPKLTGANSVYDERMGCVTDTNDKCVTCGLKKECWGHFGYIELVEPVLHPMYYKMISVFLKCFCKKCNRLLLKTEQLILSGLNKLKDERHFLKILEKIEKVDICSSCASPQPKIIFKTKDMTISMEYKQKKGENNISIIMEVDDIKKIFDNILDEDIEKLGLDPNRVHPKNLILTVLPVIPPCSRPYVVADGNICDDDLTYQLVEIVKINNQLSNSQLNSQKRQKLINTLRFRISTMFNNSKGKAKHPTDSRPLKGLKERLAGKKGRLRDNLMGKRVNFSARTVIGADPTLKLNQIGIPEEMSKILTKPEPVTEFNIEYLTRLVNNGNANFVTMTRRRRDENGEETGPEIRSRINLQYAMNRKGTELLYGDKIVRGEMKFAVEKNGNVIIPTNIEKGTKIIEVISGNEILQKNDRLIRNGKFIQPEYPTKKNITLKVGDIVERHIENGDIVLFNRQPTLHKGSMLSLETVLMPFKTFRFNLAATKSFNADFDGDEMNIHIPQSYESEAELRLISASQLNIITPQESKPIITITQDSLTAAFLMTSREYKLSRCQFSDLCVKAHKLDGGIIYNPERIKKIEKILKMHGKKPDVFNGKGVLSLLFPEDFNYQKKNNAHEKEPIVKIVQGVLIEGALDKSVLGSAHGSIIQLLNKEYGTDITSNFIDNMQFIGNAWLLIHGFSIGLEDCMITSQESVLSIKNKLTECYAKAEGIESSTHNAGIREVRVTAALSQAKDIGMKIAKEAMRKDNNFLVTVTSGSKGDYFNISQITGLLGQQNLEGKRVAPTLSHGKRTLPHYPFENLNKEREYESKGFIRHSFIRGLNPEEFFFHAMSGREGVSDTAMGTAKSGYIQRKIVKVCEDIQIQYDNTVRDTTGKIYQFCYGESGYDSTKTIRFDNQVLPVDIDRLVDRLNTDFENDISDIDESEEPKIDIKNFITSDIKNNIHDNHKINSEKKIDDSEEQEDTEHDGDEVEEDIEDDVEDDGDEVEEDVEEEQEDIEHDGDEVEEDIEEDIEDDVEEEDIEEDVEDCTECYEDY